MLASFVKVFLQHFIRHRLFSLINVLGLAIGLACCLLIALFVRYELSYDRQYAGAENIYLVDQVIPGRNDGASIAQFSSKLLAPVLRTDFPEILAVGRYVPFGNPVQLESESVDSPEPQVHYADQGFFDVFELIWIEGSPETALRGPDEIVLTPALAEKYFGGTDILGQTLLVDGTAVMRVSGVVERPPGPTTLDFTALLPVDYHEALRRARGLNPDAWYTMLYQTFIRLGEAGDETAMLQRFPNFVERHLPPRSEGAPVSLDLVPLTDLHLNRGSLVVDNFDRVMICIAIGLTILLIAVVNFVNLSTSRASTRSLEVGLRLTLGSERAQIIRHFLAEAVIMTALAMLLALVLAELLTPFVNGLLGLQLDLAAVPLGVLASLLLLATLLVGVLAGLYPAFYLSRAELARILHGDYSRGRAGRWLRSALVICQFTASIALIVAALVMYGQLRFLRELDTGFEAEGKVLIALPDKDSFDMNAGWNSLQRQLQQANGVRSVTYALDSPLMNFRLASKVTLEGSEAVLILLVPQAQEYLEQYGVSLMAGRYFDGESAADSVPVQTAEDSTAPRGSYILNLSGARALGWSPEEALGKTFRVPFGGGSMYATVVGVVEDSVSTALDAPQPALYYVPESIDFYFTNGVITLDVDPAHMEAFSANIASVWKAYFPNFPLQLRYLDQVLQGLYDNEESQKRIIGYAALVAVLIACFGLFGLAAFNAEQRRKEIGIRKVVGGSVWRIVLLLTNDFSKLVLVSNVLAWPIAYVAMQRWLENFAYRIDLTPLIFIGSGLIALCVAWVTVGGTAAKAASRKPVLALRYE